MQVSQSLISELSFRSGLSVPEVERGLSELRVRLEKSSVSDPIVLQGLGSFGIADGDDIRFTPDEALRSVVNFRYLGLGTVDVSTEVPVKPLEGGATLAEEKPSSSGEPAPNSIAPVADKKVVKEALKKQAPVWRVAAALLVVFVVLAGAFFLNQSATYQEQIGSDLSQPPSTVQDLVQEPVLPAGIAELATIPDAVQDMILDSARSSPYGLFDEFNEELRGSFTISVFSFTDIDEASEKAAVLLSDGYRLHIRTRWSGESTIWQIMIGQFEYREEAEKALLTLSEDRFTELTILQLP